MIRGLVRRQHPIGDVLHQPTFDPPGGPLPGRIRIEKNSQHHRRVIHRPAPPVLAMACIELTEIEFGDHVEHEEREVIFRQPVQYRWRHQIQLLTIPNTDVHGHPSWSPASRNESGIVGIHATALYVSSSRSNPSSTAHRVDTCRRRWRRSPPQASRPTSVPSATPFEVDHHSLGAAERRHRRRRRGGRHVCRPRWKPRAEPRPGAGSRTGNTADVNGLLKAVTLPAVTVLLPDSLDGPRPAGRPTRKRTCWPAAPTSWSRSTTATGGPRRRARLRRVAELRGWRRRRRRASCSVPALTYTRAARARRWPTLAPGAGPGRPHGRLAPDPQRRHASAATSAPPRPPATPCPCWPPSTPSSSWRRRPARRPLPVAEFLVGPKRTARRAPTS